MALLGPDILWHRAESGLLVLVGAVLIAAGVVLAAIQSGDELAGSARPAVTTAAPVSTAPIVPLPSDRFRQACRDRGGEFQVRVYFDNGPDADALMHRAVDELRGDDRVADLRTETQTQAFAEFKRLFKDRPDLLDVAHVGAMPSSVMLLPADNTSADDLATQLTGVDEIRPDDCRLPE